MLSGKLITSLAALLVSGAVSAAEVGDCAHFAWNVEHERALFTGPAQDVNSGHATAEAPKLRTDRLYQLSLSPQGQVTFVVAPGKKMLSDGAYGGLVQFHIPRAGTYRVSLSAPFWIDVVANGQLVPSGDFTGAHCDAPRKLVQFSLQPGEVVLQLSGATNPQVRVTVTPAPESNAAAPTTAH
jgi:hypothetical protein